MGKATEKDYDPLGTTMHEQALRHFLSQTRKGNDWFHASRLVPLIEVKRATLQRFQHLATQRCANSYCFDLCRNMQVAADSKTSVAIVCRHIDTNWAHKEQGGARQGLGRKPPYG